jgi:hypothetical protein
MQYHLLEQIKYEDLGAGTTAGLSATGSGNSNYKSVRLSRGQEVARLHRKGACPKADCGERKSPG